MLQIGVFISNLSMCVYVYVYVHICVAQCYKSKFEWCSILCAFSLRSVDVGQTYVYVYCNMQVITHLIVSYS